VNLTKNGRKLDRIDSQLAAAERLLALILTSGAGHRYSKATLGRRAQEALGKISAAREETRARP
jgi:hypothetical protein